MLGGLLATVTIEAPPPVEQLAILEALFPQLGPLLHHALAMLAIVQASPTQADRYTCDYLDHCDRLLLQTTLLSAVRTAIVCVGI